VFLCFLAAHLTWHLRRTLAELTYTDENPPDPIPSPPQSEAKQRRRKQPPEPAPTDYRCIPTKGCSPTSEP
jgi:hypothetical protein